MAHPLYSNLPLTESNPIIGCRLVGYSLAIIASGGRPRGGQGKRVVQGNPTCIQIQKKRVRRGKGRKREKERKDEPLPMPKTDPMWSKCPRKLQFAHEALPSVPPSYNTVTFPGPMQIWRALSPWDKVLHYQ